MKKIIINLLVLCLLSLTGCTNKKDTSNGDWKSQLSQKDKISVGISPDYPPFESYDSNSNLIGFDPELLVEVVKTLNEINDTSYEVEWVPMEFDTIISAIQTGQVDLGCSGFTYDPKREGSVLFSSKYLASSIVAVVKADSGMKRLIDIADKKIAAQTGTTCAEAANNYSNNIELIKDVNVMMEAFKADAYDVVLLDEPVAANYVDDSMVMLNEKVEDNDTYIICAARNNLLNEKISEAIDTYIKTDEYNTLVDKWGVK